MSFSSKLGSNCAQRWWAVLVLMSVFLAACGRTADPDEYIKLQAQHLERSTVPPGTVVSQRSPVSRTNWSASTAWEFETDWDWARYSNWAKSKLVPEFTLIQSGEGKFVLRKSLGGDSHMLEITAGQTQSKLRIRVDFVSHAD
jgi:hypothetical protein